MQDASPPTRDIRPFAATLLRSGARAIASHAAEHLLDSNPHAGDLFGDKAYRRWQDSLGQRIEELAAAVEFGSPELFTRDVAWSVAAFAARQVPLETVAASLDALKAAVLEDLPPHCLAAVTPIVDAGLEAARGEPMRLTRLSASTPHGELALRFLEIVLDGRRQAATDVILDAFEAGTPVADIYERVLLPVESELGTMWHLGEVSVPEEHAASEAIRGTMAVLSRAAYKKSDPEPRQGAVLVGAVEGDRHDIGVRAVADLLEIAGFTAVYLGADVPTRDLVRACESFNTQALVLSAMLTVHVPSIAEAIKAVRAAGDYRVIVGGGAFRADPELAARIGAHRYAASTTDVVKALA